MSPPLRKWLLPSVFPQLPVHMAWVRLPTLCGGWQTLHLTPLSPGACTRRGPWGTRWIRSECAQTSPQKGFQEGSRW